jgi:hypothetical protein
MLPEGRLALLLPGYSVPSSAFSRAQDPWSPCDRRYERRYCLLLPLVNSGCGCFGAFTVLTFDVPLIVSTITSFWMASVWGIPISWDSQLEIGTSVRRPAAPSIYIIRDKY